MFLEQCAPIQKREVLKWLLEKIKDEIAEIRRIIGERHQLED